MGGGGGGGGGGGVRVFEERLVIYFSLFISLFILVFGLFSWHFYSCILDICFVTIHESFPIHDFDQDKGN